MQRVKQMAAGDDKPSTQRQLLDTGGVMTSSSCSSSGRKLDHAIQVVGYNEDASTPYWIVRNSWDTTWGEDGYIYLKMGDNTCGIADAAWMVTL